MKTSNNEITPDKPIKPCPFCGSKRVNITRTNENACWIECARNSCGAESEHDASRAGAIRNWNRRKHVKGSAAVVWDMDKEYRYT